MNIPSCSDGSSLCVIPGPQEHHRARSQGPGLVRAYLSYNGLEGEAANRVGVTGRLKLQQRGRRSLMWAAELGQQVCPTWAGQAEASWISRRAQRLACAPEPHTPIPTHRHMHTPSPLPSCIRHTHAHMYSLPAPPQFYTHTDISKYKQVQTDTRRSSYKRCPPHTSFVQTYV